MTHCISNYFMHMNLFENIYLYYLYYGVYLYYFYSALLSLLLLVLGPGRLALVVQAPMLCSHSFVAVVVVVAVAVAVVAVVVAVVVASGALDSSRPPLVLLTLLPHP